MSDVLQRRVPTARFLIRRDGRTESVSSDALFEGRTVVVFALPGAFTPTCSSSHLPRFADLAPTLLAQGVDEIACISVNDPFVMEAWGRDQDVEGVTLLADADGEFTRGLGMLVPSTEPGLGERSRRYALIVRDRVIEHAFVEALREDDPYEVSDADHVLRVLAPQVAPPPDIALFTRSGCSFCATAREALDRAGLPYREHTARLRTLRALTGAGRTPVVFIDGRHVGGCDELLGWLETRAAPATGGSPDVSKEIATYPA